MSKTRPPSTATKRPWSNRFDDDDADSDPDDFSEFLSATDLALWQEFKPEIVVKLRESEGEFDAKRDELPASVFWSQEAGIVKRGIRTLINKFIDLLTSTEHKIDHIPRLKEFVSGYIRPRYPSSRKLGVRGNSGVGKSSLINSLLGQQDVVESGDAGGAMTSVCIQIKKKEKDCLQNFRAVVEFKDHQELYDMFDEWICDYQMMRQTSEDPTAGKDDTIPDHVLQRGNAAVENLTAMLCFQAKLESPTAMTQWLDDNIGTIEEFANGTTAPSQASRQKTIRGLIALSQRLLVESGVSGISLNIDANETSTLHTRLSSFTRSAPENMEDDQSKGSPWPMVKRVTIHTASPLLRRGLVLCDLPGFLDINTTRTSLARHELQKCSDIAVVADVTRILTDENVGNDLKASFKAKGGRVMLVVTGIDKINTERPATSLQETGASQELCEESERLIALAECVNKLLSRARGKAAPKRFKVFIPRLRDWRAAIATLQKEILIKARNTYISLNMNQRFKRITGSVEPLSIHFVSNSDYRKNCSSLFDEQFPISFDLTGISKLRADLAKSFDSEIKETLQRHVAEELVSMIEALDINASEDEHVQIGKVHGLIEPKTESWAAAMTELIQDLDYALDDLVIIPLHKTQMIWSQTAARQVEKWIEDLSWQKFNAMIRSEGDGSRKSRAYAGYLNWNRTFFKIAMNDCQDTLDQLRERVRESFTDCKARIKGEAEDMGSLNDYRSELEGHTKPMRQQVEETIASMLNILNEFQNEYWRCFNHMEAALTAFDSESIIYEATRPMFTAIMQAHPGGKGTVDRRKDALLVAANKGEPFGSIMDLVRMKFRNEMGSLGTRYQKEGRQAIQRMVDRLDSAIAHHQNKDPDAVAFRAALRRQVEEARDYHRDTLMPAVDKLMKAVTNIKKEDV